MTAIENIMVGADAHNRQTALDAIFRTRRHRREDAPGAADGRASSSRFVGIDRYANEVAGNLSYGDQRRVEIARALATDPRLLLLDEPAAGMNPTEKTDLMELIGRIRDRGMTVLIIEHDMKVVMGICERSRSSTTARRSPRGPRRAVQQDPRVIEAYLGPGFRDGAGAP